MAAIGEIKILQDGASGELHTEQLGYLNYNLLDSSQSDVQTTAATIKSFLQSVNSLTTHTYSDAKITYDVSLNEIAG